MTDNLRKINELLTLENTALELEIADLRQM
jgi:hypothetical protein